MVARNHKSLCRLAKLYYYDSLSEESSELIPESVNNHLEQCRDCKKEIEQLKAALLNKSCIKSKSRQNTSAVTTMLELHFAYISEHVTCETVRPFLPGLLDPAIDIRIPTPITVHLDNCRQCKEDLKKIRKLNLRSTQLYHLGQFFADRTKQQTEEYSEVAPVVKAMANRSDSEIITIYHVDESARDSQAGKSDDLYSGFPINVEVLEPKTEVEHPVVSIDFAAALKKKVAAMNLKPLLKVGLATAAVILIGIFLFRDTNLVEAEGVEQMINAIEKVDNIYISIFDPESTEPVKEIWVSHTLNVSINKDTDTKEVVLVGINTGIEKTKNLNTGNIERRRLQEDDLINAKQAMIDALGLTPFSNKSKLPPDSKWLLKSDHPEATKGIQIYDLDYKLPTGRYLYKWRCFVDSKTFFPEKIESYRISSDQSKELLAIYKIHGVSKSVIQETIRSEGFQ